MLQYLEAITKLTEENKGLLDHIQCQDRTLQFYRIENEFFQSQTTKKGRQATRENKIQYGLLSDLKKIMNQEIFPHHKFANKDQIKDLSLGSIAIHVMTKLGIDKKRMAEYWAWNYEVALKYFTDYRSGALMQMKSAFKDGK